MTDKRMLSMLRMIMDAHRKDNKDNKIGMILTDNDYTITYFIHYSEKNKKFFDKFNELYAEEVKLGHTKDPEDMTHSKSFTIENVTMRLNNQCDCLMYYIDNNCAD